MKIAVTSTGPTLDDKMDPRFGRCAYFIIVETDNMSFEAFDNESIALGGGAGIQSAQFVASKGAEAVITGNCGPNAVKTLSAAQVKVFVGQSGIVKDVVERYKHGDIKPTSTPNVPDYYGMENGTGISMGIGRGGGMGMGRGMGRRCGGGMRMSRGLGSSNWGGSAMLQADALSKEDELKQLKNQANELHKQIEALEKKLKGDK